MGIAKDLNISFVQEVVASTKAIKTFNPQTDVAIELGGEDAKITYFKDGIEQRMNGTCAGGTGSFIDQMASLLKVDTMGLNGLAKNYNTIYPIAARCGVFAKTDVQPLLNEGVAKEDIAVSVLQAIVIPVSYTHLDVYKRQSSGLAVSLGTSFENGEPWVGYYWEPEWVMAKYDLTLLEDEPYSDELWSEEAGYACEWPSVNVTVAVHKGMKEKAPEVVEFLSNYKTSKDLTNEALLYLQDNKDVDETAKWFLRENEELWADWAPADVIEKVKEAIK